jgi:hypothetical protein
MDLSSYVAGATDGEHVRSITTCEQITINEMDTQSGQESRDITLVQYELSAVTECSKSNSYTNKRLYKLQYISAVDSWRSFTVIQEQRY